MHTGPVQPPALLFSPHGPQPARLLDRPDGQVKGPGVAWGKFHKQLLVELYSFFHTSLLQRWEEKANVNDVLVYRVYF